jgi:hypothetical protein
LYFKDGATVPKEQLNQEKEQDINDEESAEIIVPTFHDSNTTNSPTPRTSMEVDEKSNSVLSKKNNILLAPQESN